MIKNSVAILDVSIPASCETRRLGTGDGNKIQRDIEKESVYDQSFYGRFPGHLPYFYSNCLQKAWWA
jgi:hypothetical protein